MNTIDFFNSKEVYDSNTYSNVKPKKILLLIDIYNWCFHHIALRIKKNITNHEFDIMTSSEFYNNAMEIIKNKYDIIVWFFPSSKYKLREIFYKHFILLELHNEANAIKQKDLKDGKSNIFNQIFNGFKERINKDKKDQEKLLDDLKRKKLKDYANSKKCEYPQTKKIYNPISHNSPYKTSTAHNPPICTTLGQNNKLRVFPYKINDYKTKIKEDTQVGSIMPKFNYNEFVEYQINDNNNNNNNKYDYTIKQSEKYLQERNQKLKNDDRYQFE